MFQKCVAALLLAVVSTYFGHVLAEGLEGGQPCPHAQAAFVSDASGQDLGGHGRDCNHSHDHDHGMSCDKWLCSGFSGVILGTATIVPLCLDIEKGSFISVTLDIFSDRTIQPRPNPPRA
jgi:hypothetical protein